MDEDTPLPHDDQGQRLCLVVESKLTTKSGRKLFLDRVPDSFGPQVQSGPVTRLVFLAPVTYATERCFTTYADDIAESLRRDRTATFTPDN